MRLFPSPASTSGTLNGKPNIAMTAEPFEPDNANDHRPAHQAEGRLVVDLDGFEGPLDVLLSLARDQKVDLARISILQLADQFIAFIESARTLHLDVAADYLVMAAWLAYLKSRLLLPTPESDEDEPTGDKLAAALAMQLRRLEAMREVGEALMLRPLLGRDVFSRGAPQGVRAIEHGVYELSFTDLLRAYAANKLRTDTGRLEIEPSKLHSMDQALRRLSDRLGEMMDWTALADFIPPVVADELVRRSATVSTFAASLELARQGKIWLRQSDVFAPIFMRSTEGQA